MNDTMNRRYSRDRVRSALVKALEETPIPDYARVVNPHEVFSREATAAALVLLGVPERRAQGLAAGMVGIPPARRLDQILRQLR